LPRSYDSGTAAVSCPGRLRRDAEIADLEPRAAVLKALTRGLLARLRVGTVNSSTPPPANPNRPASTTSASADLKRPAGALGDPMPLSLATGWHLKRQPSAAFAASHAEFLMAARAAPTMFGGRLLRPGLL
jgi:hypothetical protein